MYIYEADAHLTEWCYMVDTINTFPSPQPIYINAAIYYCTTMANVVSYKEFLVFQCLSSLQIFV